MYLHLFHGRTDPEQEMDDWGTKGPVIGPASISWKYGRFWLDEEEVQQFDDLIYFNGVFYGDAWIIEDGDTIIDDARKMGYLIDADQFVTILKEDEKKFPIVDKSPKILLHMTGGMVNEIAANRPDVQVKIMDFDNFECAKPEPYSDLMFDSPTLVTAHDQIDFTPWRVVWDNLYNKSKK